MVVPATRHAVDTIQKVAIMMGIPLNLLQKNFDANQPIRVHHQCHHDDQLTSSHFASEAQAQSLSTTPSVTPFHDPGAISSYPVYYVM